MIFNGTNNDDKSKEVYQDWLAKNKYTDKITGSKTADSCAALKVTSYTVEAFEAEDAIVISAVDEKEVAIDPEIVKRIFSLSAVSVTPRQVAPELHKKLDGLEQRLVSILFAQIAERNGRYFDDEIDKLDNWAEDKRFLR